MTANAIRQSVRMDIGRAKWQTYADGRLYTDGHTQPTLMVGCKLMASVNVDPSTPMATRLRSPPRYQCQRPRQKTVSIEFRPSV
jgi:hypothetical protein